MSTNSSARVSRRSRSCCWGELEFRRYRLRLCSPSLLSQETTILDTCFHALFTLLSQYFSLFAHATSSLSVSTNIQASEFNSPILTGIPTGNTPERIRLPACGLIYGAVTLSSAGIPHGLEFRSRAFRGTARNTTFPDAHRVRIRFGLQGVRSLLLPLSLLLSFLPDTEMRYLSGLPCTKCMHGYIPSVPDFRLSDARIDWCLHIPGPYRSLPRPSSVVEPRDPAGAVRDPKRYWSTGLRTIPFPVLSLMFYRFSWV